jgi:hypothetical protein
MTDRHQFLGKHVRVTLAENVVAAGRLLGFGEGGDFELEDAGFVYHAWPLLDIELADADPVNKVSDDEHPERDPVSVIELALDPDCRDSKHTSCDGVLCECPCHTGAVLVLYRNHRGDVTVRHVVPCGIWHGATEWHPEPQWLMQVIDLDKNAYRTFAMRDILRFGISRDEADRFSSRLTEQDIRTLKGIT